ncbi:MAG TPA: VWA domain-containing protein [Polyangiaceae bacterium]
MSHVWLPALVFLAFAATAAAYLVYRARRHGLLARPVLFAATLLALVPAALALFAWWAPIEIPYVRLERPWLALPVTVALLCGIARLERLSTRQSRTRRVLTELFSSLALVGLGLAVTGLELGRPLDRLSVLVAIDRSRSIDLVPDAESRIAAELRVAELGMRDDDRIGTIAFGTSAAVEDPLRPRSRLPAPQRAEVGRDGTDLGAAVRHGLGELPSDTAGRIVLLSDGVSTRGDPIGAGLAAVAAGVPVDVVPLDQAKVPDVRVVSVRMPTRASRDEPVELRVVTSSSAPARVELRVLRNGEPIKKGIVDIAAGEDVLYLREIAPGSGFHRYDVEVSAENPALDRAPEDNSGSAFLRVRGQATALVLERDPELAAPLVRALEGAAFRVDVKGPTGIPADVPGLIAYDLVTLSDIPASDLSPTQLAALASYVRDLGGGLLLFGSDRAMGPGGYGKTPVEEVSPVSFDVKQERRRASLAEIIAVDYSGSMSMRVGKQTKLELANEAAVRSSELLGSGDRLGVMHVDTAVRWTVPLGPVTDRAAIARSIRAVGVGGGGIFVDLTLNAAYEALERERVQLKHLLLFSDGDDAEERAGAFRLIAAARGKGVTTSVVALGQGSDVADLEQMSRIGGGRFYLIEDATRLPAVFAQETVLASRSAINEVTFRPTVATPGATLRGIDFGNAPSLTGYVVTLPKGRAQVHLTGPEGDPVLASWSVGIGRAAAFTSDFKDRWGLGWTSWDGATRLFGQVARELARRPDDPRVRLEADTEGGVFRLRANVVDAHGRRETFRRLRATIAGPDGFARTVVLEAVGSGAYAASVPLDRPGAYVATALDEAGGEPLGVAGAALSAGEELRPTGTDRALLRRIAELSGGTVRDTLAGVFHDRPPRRFAYSSISALLALLSSLALLFAVGARRLALPEALARLPARALERRKRRREVRERAASADAAAPRAPDATSAPAAPVTTGSLDALRQAKARSRSSASAPPARPLPPSAEPRPAPAAPRTPSFTPPPPSGPTSTRPPLPSARAKSAAEILLERRRGRR